MKLVEAAPAEARLAPVAKGGATPENLLVEALVLLAKRNPNPFCLLLVPLWLTSGKPCLKRRLAQEARPAQEQIN
jgi:hypothetical protein